MKNKKEKAFAETIDGKNRNTSLAEVAKLEKLLAIGNANPYGTLDSSLFEEKVNDMTLNEMQFMASRVGLVPLSRKADLKNQLIKSFKEFRATSGGLGYNAQLPQAGIDESNPHYKELMKLINQ